MVSSSNARNDLKKEGESVWSSYEYIKKSLYRICRVAWRDNGIGNGDREKEIRGNPDKGDEKEWWVTWLIGIICAWDNRNNRVCSWMHIEYSQLFEIVGIVSCSFLVGRGNG